MKHCLTIWFFLLVGVTSSGLAQQTVGLFENDPQSYNGYTLFCPLSSTITYLVDNCGFEVHRWNSSYRPGIAVYILEDGSLLHTGSTFSATFNGGGKGGLVERLDWGGTTIWEYLYASPTYHQHHDVEYLPNGNVLLLAWELKTSAEAIAKGRNPGLLSATLWPDHIIEVQPVGTDSGNIVWEWHIWDHLVQDYDPGKENYAVVAEHPELININFRANSSTDWNHSNGLDYNEELDQILISARNFSEVWIIDHSTTTTEAASHSGGTYGKGGDLLYRWGNPAAYDRGDSVSQKLFFQHNAEWVPNDYPGEGNITIFNNGLGRPGGAYSSIEEIEPPLNMDGTYQLDSGVAYGPVSTVWTYQADVPTTFYSGNVSGVQRLPNGNTLICEGNQGNFFEVEPDGNMVWRYVSPLVLGLPVMQGEPVGGNSVFRCTRYGTNYPGFFGHALLPGSPIEVNPLPTSCVISGIDDHLLPLDFQLFPNPSSQLVSVSADLIGSSLISIRDMRGVMVLQEEMRGNMRELDLSRLESGIYWIEIKGEGKIGGKKLSVIH